jgi:preprotein translocase subunit SecG
MHALQILLTLLYIPCCVLLIVVVLLQTGKRADLAGAFGGGGSQTAFGARGAATFLSKATTISAILFMLIALSLAILTARGASSRRSVLENVPTDQTAPPATPPADGVPQQAPPTPPPAPADDTQPQQP